jgi:hypothetical protein
MPLEILQELVRVELEIEKLTAHKSILLDKLGAALSTQSSLYLNKLTNHTRLLNTNKPFGDIGMSLVAPFITKKIKLLAIGFNELSSKSMKIVSDILEMNSLVHLDLVQSLIESNSIKSLERGLRLSTSLKTLVLSRNPIGNTLKYLNWSNYHFCSTIMIGFAQPNIDLLV